MTTTASKELPEGPARLPWAMLALVNAVIIGGLSYDFVGGLIA